MSTARISLIGGNAEHGDVMVVETRAPEGYVLESHRHRHAHVSVLVSGVADLTIDGNTVRIEGYTLVPIPADVVHKVEAITPIVWLCLWASQHAPRKEAEASLSLVPGCASCPAGCEPT